jgi:hypothetical protein
VERKAVKEYLNRTSPSFTFILLMRCASRPRDMMIGYSISVSVPPSDTASTITRTLLKEQKKLRFLEFQL